MKSLKLSDYFSMINPEYSYLKMTPNNSLKNNQTDKIALSIASLAYSALIRTEKGFIWHLPFGRNRLFPTQLSVINPAKVSYYIYLTKTSAEFYFIIPTLSLSIIKEKIRSVWTTVTMREVEKNMLPTFTSDATAHSLSYTQEDALSLVSDKRDDDLLSANLNLLNVLEEDDKVGIFYNFIPTNQNWWRSTYRNTINKVKASESTEKEKGNLNYLLKFAASQVQSISDLIAEMLSSKKAYTPTPSYDPRDPRIIPSYYPSTTSNLISNSTRKKQNETIIDTQILILSESDSRIRQHNNAKSLAHSFQSISEPEGGNTLKTKHYRQTFNPTIYSLPSANRNKLSSAECQNLIALPGRKLLERHTQIAKTETQETQVPSELKTGVMCIGKCTYRGVTQEAFLSTDKEHQQLTLVVVGPTRAGKTTLLGSLAKDAIVHKECVIMFDFIKNCEASKEVAENFTEDQALVISCANLDELQGLGYNEFDEVDNSNVMDAYINAKRQTQQLLTLVNSINSDDKNLAPRMERFLTCASLITFIQKGSIKDVFDVLSNHETRAHFIFNTPSSQKTNLEEYILGLKELDELDSKTKEVIGTKTSNITNIIDRLQKLKANPYMELMLKKGTENNISLIKELQKPQLIILQMPEKMFSTDAERDVYTTYWMTKIYLALQLRADIYQGRDDELVKVNLIIDEIYQVHHTEEFLTEKLSRLAKFKLKPILSCHYLNQIKVIRDELRSANASYMLISGCDKKNFAELEEELYPYEVDDLLHLPRFHSLNLIKSSARYERFITDLTNIGKHKKEEKKVVHLSLVS